MRLRYIWGSELKFYNIKMVSWIYHINVNMFWKGEDNCLNGKELFDTNCIYYTSITFPLKKYTCIFESPFINFAPSIIVIYENRSWSGVWISPIRYFLIFSNSCLMLISSPFSICKKSRKKIIQAFCSQSPGKRSNTGYLLTVLLCVAFLLKNKDNLPPKL